MAPNSASHHRGFHEARIIRVIDEAADTRTYVLDAPFPYRAGQFVTFRACGTLRSYSMSSSPDTDGELATTVKRVPGGLVSNWMLDHLDVGDTVEITAPAGVFCLRETDAPLVAFAGGSGITPIMSLVKSALATTARRVRVLTANRDRESVIFAAALESLAAEHPGRLEIRHHLDADGGYVTKAEVLDFLGEDRDADFYLCGPEPFMDLIEGVLRAHGADGDRIRTERFNPAADDDAVIKAAVDNAEDNAGENKAEAGGTITITLDGKTRRTGRIAGLTLLLHARRAGLMPPFSCEAGECATCMAHVTAGEVKMRNNEALDEDEVADGWVLTCQAEPVTPDVTVTYDD